MERRWLVHQIHFIKSLKTISSPIENLESFLPLRTETAPPKPVRIHVSDRQQQILVDDTRFTENMGQKNSLKTILNLLKDQEIYTSNRI